MRIVGNFVRKKFQGDEAAELGVFGLVNDAHSAAAEFFDDAVVRDGLADEGGRLGHRGRFYGGRCGESMRRARGLALTGSAIAWSFGSWLQGRRTWNRRIVLRLGTALIGVGTALVALSLHPAVPVVVCFAAWAVSGFGIGMV